MRALSDAVHELQVDSEVFIKRDISGSDLTTLKVGGGIPFLIEVETVSALSKLIKLLRQRELPYKVLGGGSNLLIPDDGVSTAVIRLGRSFREYEVADDGAVNVGGGKALMTLSKDLANRGLSGLEFAAGIPATMGGAVRMNAGAHGGETGSVVESVETVSSQGEILEIPAAQLDFSYRKTSIPIDSVVTRVLLRMQKQDSATCMEKLRTHLDYRRATQPLQEPSFGSVFKNPPEKAAGALIEELGLKGYAVGGAKISEMHGNWITNPNRKASASDVLRLIEHCQKGVFEAFGLTLEPEVVRW